MNFIRTQRNLKIKCSHVVLRMMASLSQRGDHAILTATQQRQRVVSKAIITKIRNISPTVKWLQLQIRDVEFGFKPGQWVDFILPETDTLSGYSICSSPRQLKTDGSIELAVKISEHPVAVWVHQQCEEGVEVRLQSGGDFFYDPKLDAGELERDILLLAGGVGINPLVSIFRHLADLQSDPNVLNNNGGKVCLLYSARSDDELIFKERITSICSRFPNMKAKFFVTKETQSVDGLSEFSGRIDAAVINQALTTFSSKHRLSFVCGPPQMLADMEKLFITAGFRPDEIRYEKWW